MPGKYYVLYVEVRSILTEALKYVWYKLVGNELMGQAHGQFEAKPSPKHAYEVIIFE
jgi:hypothetical protein